MVIRRPGNPAHAGLIKDIEYKSYSKAELKTYAGTEADKFTGAERHVNGGSNGMSMLYVRLFLRIVCHFCLGGASCAISRTVNQPVGLLVS